MVKISTFLVKNRKNLFFCDGILEKKKYVWYNKKKKDGKKKRKLVVRFSSLESLIYIERSILLKKALKRRISMNNHCTQEEFDSKIKRVLISQEEIQEAIAIAGKKISESYDGRPILLVSILKGAFVFMSDLCRAITCPCEIGFMCAKSYYAGTTSSGIVSITMDLDQDVSNYHVIIVEDIVDTGRTLNDVVKLLKERNPLSLRVVTLLDKPSRRVVDFQPDMSLFTIPDQFVIGYGLDCAELYRNLPYIAEYNLEEK